MKGGKQGKVLVFGDDMRIFLAVVRSLGRAGIEVHAAPLNRRYPALTSRYIAAKHYFPSYSEGPDAWRDAVARVLREHAFDLVVPCCDPAIIPLHIHREDFKDHRIAIPNSACMDLLFDKELTRRLCEQLRVNIVQGERLGPAQDAAELVARFGLPLVIKPRRSYWNDALESWGKVWIPETEGEVQDVLSRIEDRSRYLVEAYFEGAGTGVSVLAKDGEILQAFQHRRLREGRGGNSSLRISEPVHDELLAACKKIGRHLELDGVCMFEFRVNHGTGDWILIETNARFWGSLPLPVSIGVNFPLYLYNQMVRKVRHESVAYPYNVKSRNLTLDGYNLINRIRSRSFGATAIALAECAEFAAHPIRCLAGREYSDSMVMDDFKPAFWEIASLLGIRAKNAGNQDYDPNKVQI